MKFSINFGIPEMRDLWLDLSEKANSNDLSEQERNLYQKWGRALRHLSLDPKYPGLNSHEIPQLTKRVGKKVWQSYLENRKSGAMRMYWVYGPQKQEITIIGLASHPEDKKNDGYEKITLSSLT